MQLEKQKVEEKPLKCQGRRKEKDSVVAEPRKQNPTLLKRQRQIRQFTSALQVLEKQSNECKAVFQSHHVRLKRLKVVQRLVVKFLTPTKSNLSPQPTSEPYNKLSDDDKKEIAAFYMRNDISWMAPGKKDYVIVKRNGKKEKEQKKFLMMSLKEAHTLFSKDHPHVKVGRSKFAQLRPDTMMLSCDMPHNMCVCKYHANIDLLLEGLSVMTALPRSHRDLLLTLVCDIHNEDCMLHYCNGCKSNTDLESLEKDMDDTTTHMKWFQWDKSEGGQMMKVFMMHWNNYLLS